MADILIDVWFLVLMFGLSAIVYRTFQAIDYSKIFRRNSTWEIRTLVLLLSIAIAYLVASAFISVLERIMSIA